MGRHGTIAGRKEKQDAKRAAVFTKYSRAISVAAKNGGDPEYNALLKHAIDKAKSINMPNDKITRAIKKGTGELEGSTYEEGRFEGYGAGGVAVIVDILTDNKNRTTSSIKHIFDKHGGNLGTPGCVGYMFEKRGLIVIEKTEGLTENEVMEVGLDANMEDMTTYEDSFEVFLQPEDVIEATKAFRDKGYTIISSDVEFLPNIEMEPNESDLINLRKMIEQMEDDDDVQKVYHNSSIDLD